ncbi:DciA family protein [Streptomyces sp. NPDC055140]
MSEDSGVDLAHVVLRAAKESARKNGGGQTSKPQPQPGRAAARDGREPASLGAAISALITERAWELPAACATLRERWEAIAPLLAEHVDAVAYDANSGQLTVCPDSLAWALQTRIEESRVIEAANKSAGRTVVCAPLRILQPGSARVP